MNHRTRLKRQSATVIRRHLRRNARYLRADRSNEWHLAIAALTALGHASMAAGLAMEHAQQSASQALRAIALSRFATEGAEIASKTATIGIMMEAMARIEYSNKEIYKPVRDNLFAEFVKGAKLDEPHTP